MSIIIHSFLSGAKEILNPFYKCLGDENPSRKLYNSELPTPLDDIKNSRKDWQSLKSDLELSKNKVLGNG